MKEVMKIGLYLPMLYHTIPHHTIVLFQAKRPISTIQLNTETRIQKISKPTADRDAAL